MTIVVVYTNNGNDAVLVDGHGIRRINAVVHAPAVPHDGRHAHDPVASGRGALAPVDHVFAHRVHEITVSVRLRRFLRATHGRK